MLSNFLASGEKTKKSSLLQHLQVSDTDGSFSPRAADKHRKGCQIRAGEKPSPVREKKPCQPISRVSAPQARLYRDGALGCPGSTGSEGDKGAKAFTTSAAETFVSHYKRNMAALPGLNPHPIALA